MICIRVVRASTQFWDKVAWLPPNSMASIWRHLILNSNKLLFFHIISAWKYIVSFLFNVYIFYELTSKLQDFLLAKWLNLRFNIPLPLQKYFLSIFYWFLMDSDSALQRWETSIHWSFFWLFFAVNFSNKRSGLVINWAQPLVHLFHLKPVFWQIKTCLRLRLVSRTDRPLQISND